MNKVITSFNFLPFCENIYDLCKQFTFYDREEIKKVADYGGNWPGKRTLDLKDYSPFLFLHVCTLLEKSHLVKLSDYKEISMCCHLRLQKDDDNDWIHTDISDTALIYLSKTNFNSGTDFFDNQNNTIVSTKFTQGTLTFFEKGIKHSAIGNHGDSIENGRMTINIFMFKK